MTERRIDGFFYGLFMDSNILKKNHIAAVAPRRAYVDDYGLRIGQRATLVPTPGERAYGMLFALTHDELDKLYNAPGLEQYRPEAILAQSLEGENFPALCYNLREAPGANEANAEYAASLRTVLSRLNFPSEYITSIS
ncbi:gamma-glutamylcyclotransferase family protein [Aliikangiella coralliicola]|uniref:Gamma-glutamylcyclotransferase n=1 Tax=Aliikangiella coralliicola TaxID=2592383 RepID=A0A545UEL2_9GAMM|nr:gamma-glutamylcyclotransferase family protein [Aliikangiella coralliicola]TQV87919.1 gamma-glutamylcyclotransferase [Aliikangiella coralliicola]